MNSIPLLLALALLAPPGPWELTLPVDGLTHANAGDFKERVLEHFANTSPGSRLLGLRTHGDLAVIRIDARGSVRLSDLRAALKGSGFALRPRSWFAYGRVALEWETEHELSSAQIDELEAALGSFGSVGKTEFDGTRSAEVIRVAERKGFVYHAHIRFKERGQGPASKIEIIVRAIGIDMKDPTLLWESHPHMPWHENACGARRK